jgi:hypothetical protein
MNFHGLGLHLYSRHRYVLDDLVRDPFVWPARLRISKTVSRWRAGVGFTQAGSEVLTDHTGRSAKQIASFEVSTDKLLVYKTENERLAHLL